MNRFNFINLLYLTLSSALIGCIQMKEDVAEQSKTRGEASVPQSQVISSAIQSLGHVDTRPRVYFDLDFSDGVSSTDQLSFTENLENRQLLKLSILEARGDRGRISIFLPNTGVESIEIELSDKNGRRIFSKSLRVKVNKIIQTSI